MGFLRPVPLTASLINPCREKVSPRVEKKLKPYVVNENLTIWFCEEPLSVLKKRFLGECSYTPLGFLEKRVPLVTLMVFNQDTHLMSFLPLVLETKNGWVAEEFTPENVFISLAENKLDLEGLDFSDKKTLAEVLKLPKLVMKLPKKLVDATRQSGFSFASRVSLENVPQSEILAAWDSFSQKTSKGKIPDFIRIRRTSAEKKTPKKTGKP